jgi:hypothetical protein
MFPSEILPNGEFEEGCFGPWTVGGIHEGGNITAVIEPCAAGQCAPGGGDYYAHMYGQPSNTASSAIGLGNYPVISPGVDYTLTCNVKVIAGYVRSTIGTNAGVVSSPVLEPAAGWQTLTVSFTGAYGTIIQIIAAYTPPSSGQTAYFESLLNGCSVVAS